MQSGESELLVSVDVGCYRHAVAIGLSGGQVLDEFEVDHDRNGFKTFFDRIDQQEQAYGLPVLVAMEGYNGHARPLDRLVRARNYRLFNINNLKLARFKEIFPAAAKTDILDARKGLELFQLRHHLPLAKDVLQEVGSTPVVNEQLKRLTRRRRRMVNERVRVVNAIQSDLRAVCPGLLAITQDVSQIWFINLLTSVKRNVKELAGKRESSLLKLRGVGKVMLARIQAWQKQACFSDEAELVSAMILEDAHRIKDLNEIIKALDTQIESLASQSEEAMIIRSAPGFGRICCAELAGEIGTVERFEKEASLALYLGMAPLDNASGTYRGSKSPRQVNRHAKAAMMTAVDRHRKHMPESQAYYEKKRLEGKAHNQAIRSLGRHLCRVLFKMLKDNKPYEIRQPKT
jgi:transposase